jgi:hypothetical protein
MLGLLEQPLAALSAWLADTSLSHLLQNVDWLVPAIQTVHILGIAVVMAAVLMVALGAFGLHGRGQPLARTVARFAPAVYLGVPVLLLSGLLMITAEPDRALPNPAFQIKMALLVLALTLSTFAARRAQRTGRSESVPAGFGLRVAAAVALGLWLAVLVAGRWIAYTLSH